MMGLGFWEVVLILIVALLVLGPEKLPKVARQLGRGVRELRKAAADFQHSLSEEVRDLEDVASVKPKPPPSTAVTAKGASDAIDPAATSHDAAAESVPRSPPSTEAPAKDDDALGPTRKP